jgi:hypothetical protein
MASSTARQGAYSTRLLRERCVRGWMNQQVIDLLKRPAHERGYARRRDPSAGALGIAFRAHGGSCVVRPQPGGGDGYQRQPTDRLRS